MPAPYNNVCQKTELAAKAIVDALSLAGVEVNTGQDTEEITLPCVICSAEKATEEVVKSTGVFYVGLTVEVRSSADDEAMADHRERTATIFDTFADSTIVSQMSDLTDDYTAFEVNITDQTESRDDRHFVSSIEMQVACCGSDIS